MSDCSVALLSAYSSSFLLSPSPDHGRPNHFWFLCSPTCRQFRHLRWHSSALCANNTAYHCWQVTDSFRYLSLICSLHFFFSAWVSYYLLAGWLPVDCLFCFFFFFYMSLLCNTFLAIVCHSLQHYEFLRHIRTHMHSYLPPELCAYPTNRHHQHHIFFFLQIPLSVHAHIHTHTHTNIVKRDICSPVAARLQLTALYTISFFYIFSDTNVLPRPLNPSAHEFVAVHLSNFLCCQMCS